jgi:hypothetical protein
MKLCAFYSPTHTRAGAREAAALGVQIDVPELYIDVNYERMFYKLGVYLFI